MKVTTLFLLAQTIWVPVLVCLWRFSEVKSRYWPLFIYLLAKELTEIISILLIKVYKTGNEVPYNFMYLLEALLINWQFFKLGAYGKKKNVYFILQFSWVAVWCIDVFWIGSITDWNINFRIAYCSTMVYVAVSLISKFAVTVKFNIYFNTGFLLSLFFACWFAYNIVYEFAEQMAHTSGPLLRMSNRVTGYFGFVEAFMYLGIAWAIYCIRIKKIKPFS